MGTVYLLHFDERYKHAGHYLGFADEKRSLHCRLHEHATGYGARLTQVVREAGIGWQLARTWRGDRKLERRLKNMGGAARICPICKAQKASEKQEERDA